MYILNQAGVNEFDITKARLKYRTFHAPNLIPLRSTKDRQIPIIDSGIRFGSWEVRRLNRALFKSIPVACLPYNFKDRT